MVMLPLLGSLASAILFLALFGWLAEEVFEGELRQFDLRTRNFVHQFATPPLTKIMQGFTGLGSVGALSILFAIVVACFVLGKLRGPAAWLVIAMSGALILDVTLKLAFHRARPVPFFRNISGQLQLSKRPCSWFVRFLWGYRWIVMCSY